MIRLSTPMWNSKVEFEDGHILCSPHSKDLDESVPYGNLIHENPYLFSLKFKANLVSRQIASLRKLPITSVKPDNDVVYVKLRCCLWPRLVRYSIHTNQVRCKLYFCCPIYQVARQIS